MAGTAHSSCDPRDRSARCVRRGCRVGPLPTWLPRQFGGDITGRKPLRDLRPRNGCGWLDPRPARWTGATALATAAGGSIAPIRRDAYLLCHPRHGTTALPVTLRPHDDSTRRPRRPHCPSQYQPPATIDLSSATLINGSRRSSPSKLPRRFCAFERSSKRRPHRRLTWAAAPPIRHAYLPRRRIDPARARRHPRERAVRRATVRPACRIRFGSNGMRPGSASSLSR